jgi:hypothetical protein
MSKTYVNLEFKWGASKFYEKSKTAKEGFDAIEYIDSKTKEPKTTYHRLVDTVEGTISSVAVQESPYGRNLKVNLQTDTKNEIISIAVKLDDKYGYSREAMAFISSLRGYKLGEEVSINPVVSRFTKNNGKEGMNVAFYINYKNINEGGKSASTGYIDNKEIPALEKEVKLGKETYNSDKRMQFYFDTLESITAKFTEYWDKIKADAAAKKAGDQTQPDKSTKEPVKEAPEGAMAPNEKFDDEDLPF